MMNLLIDFDTLNEHFGARRRLPDIATARARRRGIGREQRRASLASAISRSLVRAGDYKNMPCKYAYYGELVMKLAGDWLRACFAADDGVVGRP